LFVFCLSVLWNCSSHKPFIARAPEEKSEKFHLSPDISEVNIPVNLTIQGMTESINKQLTGLLYEGKQIKANDNITLDIKVWKQAPIQLDVVDNEVIYTVPLKIWTNTFFKLSLLGIPMEDQKEADCAIELSFRSKVFLDSLWKVQTITTLEKYTWLQKPVIKIGNFELPLGLVADYVLKNQKEVLVQTLDQQVKDQLDVKPYILQAWNKLQNPIQVSDKPAVWLLIKPINAFMSPFIGKTGNLSSSIGITAYVESHFGTKPALTLAPLPALKFSNNGPNEFKISMVGEITYDQAKELAKNNLAGQTFEFNDGKQKVTVTDIDLYPVGEMLAIKTTLTGSLNGVVYLKGLPVYDSLSRAVKLIQTQFDIETKNKLHKTASWLLHGALEKRIESSMHYSLADQLKLGEELIRKSLNHNRIATNIVLNGSLSQLSPKKIILTPTSIKTVVNAKGKLDVQIEGF